MCGSGGGENTAVTGVGLTKSLTLCESDSDGRGNSSPPIVRPVNGRVGLEGVGAWLDS